MRPLPWRYVEDWSCTNCGLCCRGYNVVLNFHEWLNIIKTYGIGAAASSLNRFYIGRKADGSCIFLGKISDKYYCTLQSMKPRACKLWPFKITSKPRFGRGDAARYYYGNKEIYIYIDPFCRGIRWGTPGIRLMYKILPEFVEIALGLREKQVYTTSTLPYNSFYLKLKYERKLT